MLLKLEMSPFFHLFGDYVPSFDLYHISEYSIMVKPIMNIKTSQTMCPVSWLHAGRRNDFNIGGDTYRKLDRSVNVVVLKLSRLGPLWLLRTFSFSNSIAVYFIHCN